MGTLNISKTTLNKVKSPPISCKNNTTQASSLEMTKRLLSSVLQQQETSTSNKVGIQNSQVTQVASAKGNQTKVTDFRSPKQDANADLIPSTEIKLAGVSQSA